MLDTTVLVYALGGSHELREPCARLVAGISDRSVEATTTAEVVQEFAHVRARRHGRSDAAELAASYADLLTPLLTVEEAHLRRGLDAFRDHPRLGCFDAVLAAACLAVGAQALISADSAFGTVPGLTAVFPDRAGVDRLLSA